MSFVVIVCLIAVILFLFPYVTKRRFGTLGLALAAGSLLGTMWSQEATRLVSEAGVQLVTPPLQSVVMLILTLGPALLVLRSGPVYHSTALRVGGSVLFALMAVSLLLPTFATALYIEAAGRSLYDVLKQYNTFIITVGLVAATVDVFLTKTHKSPKSSGKH